MLLKAGLYHEQLAHWPQASRHILAQFDGETIIVYQSFCPRIAEFAMTHGFFGGDYRYQRMSWIKPTFLWMMYRNDWGRAPSPTGNRQHTLAIRLRREFFDSILAQAVPATYVEILYESFDAWQKSLRQSEVRLQWDPDHAPDGSKCERRAIQLGLRGEALEAYGKRECLEIIDMTQFVAEQSAFVDESAGQYNDLVVPIERVYRPADQAIANRIGLAESA